MADERTGSVKLTWKQIRSAMSARAFEVDDANSGPLWCPLSNDNLDPQEVREIVDGIGACCDDIRRMLDEWEGKT